MKPTAPLLAAIIAVLASSTLAAEPSSPQTKAEQVVIPKLTLKKARVHEAVRFLTQKSRELDPAKTGVSITFAAPPDDETRVTIDLANVSLAVAAKRIAEAADLQLRTDGDNIVLKSKRPDSLTPANPDKEVPSIPGLKPVSLVLADESAGGKTSLDQLRELASLSLTFASSHDGRLPKSLDEVLSVRKTPNPGLVVSPLAADKSKPSYELLLPGQRLGSIADPARTVSIRSLFTLKDGRRPVAFVDGHVEILDAKP